MSLEELKELKEKLESEQYWSPVYRTNYKFAKKGDSYVIGKGEKESGFLEKDETEKLISKIEEVLKDQVSRMVGTPYDYTMDLLFDFGLVCKSNFASKFCDFVEKNDPQATTYKSALLKHSIPKKVVMKVGTIFVRCYYNNNEITDAQESIHYPADARFVVDFDNLISKLSDLGYELRINNPFFEKDECVQTFESIASAFNSSDDYPEGVHIFVDFRKSLEKTNSTKTYGLKASSSNKKKNTENESK